MVNALEHNTSILYLPRMEWDRAEQVKAVKEQFNANNATNSAANSSPPQPIKSSFLHRKSADQSGGKKERRVSISEQPLRTHVVKAMLRPSMGRQLSTLGEEQGGPTNDTGSSSYDLLRTLDEKWDTEIMRLDEFLRRNVNLINGLAVSHVGEESHYNNSNQTFNPVMITV